MMLRTALASLTLAAVLTGPARADISPADLTALADTAAAEWRVYVNCSRTDPDIARIITEFLNDDLDAAQALLVANGMVSAVSRPILARARPEALMLPPDAPISDLLALCPARWIEPINLFEHFRLEAAIAEALSQ